MRCEMSSMVDELPGGYLITAYEVCRMSTGKLI